MNSEELKHAHQALSGAAERFRQVLIEQISSLLTAATLGVPIESRVKSWSSIEERLTRKPVDLKSIADLDDLIGVRIILLFRRDLDAALQAIRSSFDVLSSEDKASVLEEGQFGYQSHHLVVRLPQEWLKVPSYSGFGQFKAELQIRTLAQHIWAAASHKLQYKQEQSVPLPVKRSINRVSALLETVDLEFERVLDERQSYSVAIDDSEDAGPLNVDLLASVLAEVFPAENRSGDEDYSDLLEDLAQFKVQTAKGLRDLIKRNLDGILAAEAARVEEQKVATDPLNPERLKKGVFYTHAGLARSAMLAEYGKAFDDYQQEQAAQVSKKLSKL